MNENVMVSCVVMALVCLVLFLFAVAGVTWFASTLAALVL